MVYEIKGGEKGKVKPHLARFSLFFSRFDTCDNRKERKEKKKLPTHILSLKPLALFHTHDEVLFLSFSSWKYHTENKKVFFPLRARTRYTHFLRACYSSMCAHRSPCTLQEFHTTHCSSFGGTLGKTLGGTNGRKVKSWEVFSSSSLKRLHALTHTR